MYGLGLETFFFFFAIVIASAEPMELNNLSVSVPFPTQPLASSACARIVFEKLVWGVLKVIKYD